MSNGSGIVGSWPTVQGPRAPDDAVPTTDRPVLIGASARATSGVAMPVVSADGDAAQARVSRAGVHYVAQTGETGERAASVVREDDAAPADPDGTFDLLTARAEGAGFPAVTAGDAVSQQGTVAGVPLVAQASPSGDRFADVDAHDDAAPAAPRGGYTLDVARAEGTPSAAVVDGDAVAPTTSLNAVRYAAITDSALSRVADVDAENEPGPAAPRGLYAGGRATTASPAFTDGDYTPANFDLSGRQRVTVPNPGNGKTAIHVTFTNAALAAGTSTQTVHTGTASRETKVTSVVARYVGTTAGVTLQLLAGGQRADIAADNLTTDKDVNLLGAGRVVYLTGAETLQVVVTGATLNDTLEVRVQGEEETA